jgi:hypothetical protein
VKKNFFSLLFVTVFMAGTIVAWYGRQPAQAPLVTPPAISVEISGDECPSIEVQAGMQVAWTNRDVVDHIILLERVDKDGDLVDSGGTDLLQPGSTFSIILTEPGQYTYYCSEDRALSGTISVSP